MWGSAGDRDGSLGRQMVTQTSMEATSRWACYSRSPGTRLALTGLRRCDSRPLSPSLSLLWLSVHHRGCSVQALYGSL